MAYDTKTVLTRYANLQDLPEGEPVESMCPHVGGAVSGTCETGACQSCCLGVVEMVRRYQEQCTEDTLEPERTEPAKAT